MTIWPVERWFCYCCQESAFSRCCCGAAPRRRAVCSGSRSALRIRLSSRRRAAARARLAPPKLDTACRPANIHLQPPPRGPTRRAPQLLNPDGNSDGSNVFIATLAYSEQVRPLINKPGM